MLVFIDQLVLAIVVPTVIIILAVRSRKDAVHSQHDLDQMKDY